MSQKRFKCLPTSQSKKTANSTYFKEILESSGVTLTTEGSHILTQEQALVKRDIEKTLKKHYYFPNNCEEFVQSLEIYCKNNEKLKSFLQATELQKNVDEDETFAPVPQECIIRLLLGVNCLQEKLTDLLLKKAAEKTLENTTDFSFHLLLSPFKYLTYFTASKELSKKLIELLDICDYEAQIDILLLIPDIVQPSDHGALAKGLIKLLGEKAELTGALVDCFNCLGLSDAIREEVQDHILTILQCSSTINFFPILFEFLVTDTKQDKLNTILQKVRNALDSILDHSVNVDTQVVIFYKVKQFFLLRKNIVDNLISIITKIHSSKDHKPIDLLILLMVHSVDQTRKKSIEILFKNKVKHCVFKIPLLHNMFAKINVPKLLTDYHRSIIKIASCLITQMGLVYEPLKAEFGGAMYKLLFTHEHSDFYIRKEVLSDLIFFTGSLKSPEAVLDILSDLAKERAKLTPHVLQLMSLLQITDLKLNCVKKIFNVLCSLIYAGEDAETSMQNELHMLIRKQLRSADKLVKHRGIIAAICAVDYLTNSESDGTEKDISMEDTLITITDIPRGSSRDAAELLQLTNSSLENCPEAMCLYYDQLSQIIVSSNHKEKYFMGWLTDTVSNDFQNHFVTETVPKTVNGIELSIQYNLNSAEEVECPVSINIGEIALKKNNDVPILILSPLFRLLRLLHYRQYNGNLSSIDALLGCGIIMPKLDDDLVFDSAFDAEQTKQVADCLFHCINWFRETISAFCNQKRKHRHRVVARLQDIINLEELLESCMRTIPDHRLPVSYVDAVESCRNQWFLKPAVPRKKTSSNVSFAASGSKTTQNTQIEGPSKKIRKGSTKKAVTKPDSISIKYRDFDTDIITLIKYPLQIDENPDINLTQNSSVGTAPTMTLKQLKFLFKDFVMKLELLTKSKTKLGLSHLNIVQAEDFLTDCRNWLIFINKHMCTVTEKIASLMQKTDGRHDLPEMFTDEATDLKLCFGQILQIYSLIFGWSGFQHSKNAALLKDCLKSWRIVGQSQSQMIPNKTLITEFMSRIFSYVEKCFDLHSAIAIVNIVKALYDLNNDADTKKKLNTISGKFLTVKWYTLHGNPDSGRLFTINIDALVKAHLNGISLKNLSGLVSTLQLQVPKLTDKDQVLPAFNAIDQSNFPVLYRGICGAQLEALKTAISDKLTNDEHMDVWRINAVTMQGLTAIIRMHENKTNLQSFLKKSLGIIKLFLTHGIPILEILLKPRTDRVIEVLKSTQQSVRFLHHLCCQSKYTKDRTLMVFVPQFRQLFETMVYRVKAALVANDCSAAFWMGPLKNKDIRGEEILSQSTVSSSSSQQSGLDMGSDEELPPSDNDEDEDANSDMDVDKDYNRTSELF